MEFVVITGMSGAGKSNVMNALEDIGFFCVDNLPAKLIPVFAELVSKSQEHKRVAVVTDVRAGQSFSELFDVLDQLKELQISYKLLFIDADDATLTKRFKETRRKHPLLDSTQSIQTALTEERKLLSKARSHADLLLETSSLSATECRIRVISMFSDTGKSKLHIHCLSFGYKHGVPNDADYIFDVRALPNPFYVPDLKNHTGLEFSVSDYVMRAPQSKEFCKKLFEFVDYSASLFEKEDRTQLIIGIGCTGGHHRSVTVAELLYKHLKDTYSASVSHRDITK